MIPKKYKENTFDAPGLIGKKLKHATGAIFIPLTIKYENGKIYCDEYKSIENPDNYNDVYYFIGSGGRPYWDHYEIIEEHITNWKGEFDE